MVSRKDLIIGAGFACFLGMTSLSSVAEAESEFTIGSVLDPTICTQLLVAQDKGIFKKHRVPAAVKLFSSGALITQAIAGGSLQFGATGGVPGTLLAGHDVGVRMIARLSDISWELALLAMPQAKITKPADVAGKTIGMTGGTVSQYLVMAFAEHWNIPVSSLRLVNLAPADQFNALVTGKIDVASLWLPFTTKAEESGAVVLETALKANFPGQASNVKLVGDPGILFGANDFLDKNPDVTIRLLQAIYEAEQWMAAHPEEAADVSAAHLKVAPQTLVNDFKHAQINMRFDPELVAELRNEWDFLKRIKVLPGDFAEKPWIDPSFMRRAVPSMVSVK